jgi:ABC-2 type transport system ATP-binding protein
MIEIRDFSRRYGDVQACDGISFTVAENSFTALLGRNGAGKSTILKAVCGATIADKGSVRVNGYNLAENPVAAKRLIGCVFEDSPLYGDMTVTGYLSFVASVYGMEKDSRRDAVDNLIRFCDLGDYAERRCGNLSKGTRQRVSLAQALVHDPSVIILDEPTTGLDPLQTAEFLDLLKSLTGKKTVLYSTHILQEIEPLCTDIVILDQGKILAQGSKESILERTNASSMGEAFLSLIDKGKERDHA